MAGILQKPIGEYEHFIKQEERSEWSEVEWKYKKVEIRVYEIT